MLPVRRKCLFPRGSSDVRLNVYTSQGNRLDLFTCMKYLHCSYNTLRLLCSVVFLVYFLIHVLTPSFSFFIYAHLLRAVLDFFLLFVSSYVLSSLPYFFRFFFFAFLSCHVSSLPPCPVKFLAPVIARLSSRVLHLCVVVSDCLLYRSACLVSRSLLLLPHYLFPRERHVPPPSPVQPRFFLVIAAILDE